VETDGTNGGGKCLDSFSVSTNTGQSTMGVGTPVICGQNTGQHIYVDMGTLAGDTATLNFAFGGDSSNRAWEVKVSQVPCAARYAPEAGCTQYQTGLTGRITSFNFDSTTDNHLQNQNYNVCIRPEDGFCCIQYQVCSDPGSFSLSGGGQDPTDPTKLISIAESGCTNDYIDIPGSSANCNQGSQNANALTNKYCGSILNPTVGATVNVPICDCTAPFQVSIVTDAMTDPKDAATAPDATTANLQQSRGVCLDYTQIPCA
jgi:hypothetical protein